MNRRLSYRITAKDAGKSVLEFLKEIGCSHRILLQIKNTPGGLLLNGEKPFGRTLLSTGSTLELLLAEDAFEDKILPTPMPLSILYEDDDLCIVNKAADTPIHPSMGNHEFTLANAAAYHFRGQEIPYRCINRLDRDTTGALILAKHSLAASVLGMQMRKREIRRTYLALVEGCPPASGTIRAPIARKEASSILREVNFETGESACTHWERLETKNGLSLLELHLETGRTHQIRVHMNYLGYPLPGDYLYHPDFRLCSRQPLHSYQLEFTHPVSRKAMRFTAPVPEDMLRAFTF